MSNSVVPPSPAAPDRNLDTLIREKEISMTRTVWIAVGLVVIIALVSITFGTFVPTNAKTTPYFSSLSNMAVSTADACPCNQKVCSAGVCVDNPNPDDPRFCCIQGSNCTTGLCFP
jgi:hypothetical protein